MIVHKNIHDSALPLYEVEEVSMAEALTLLETQKRRGETLISRAGNKLRMNGNQQRRLMPGRAA